MLPARLRRHGSQKVLFLGHKLPERQPASCFCTLSADLSRGKVARRSKRIAPATRRFESTVATTPVGTDTKPRLDPRKELESVLLALQNHAAKHVDISQLQLAINGLRQQPGEESIRVAVLGLANDTGSSNTARQVLKLLLADPLKDAQAWEQEVENHDLAEPMIVRIGVEERSEEPGISLKKENLLREVNVSRAGLNEHRLEILLAATNPSLLTLGSDGVEAFEDTVLMPIVNIPTSTNSHRTTAVPVHKTLVVADGIRGVLPAMSLPSSENPGIFKYTVNIPEYKPADTASLPFTPIDAPTADAGLALVRKNIGNAIEYEHLWFQSNLPKLVEWLKADIATTPDNVTKPPVRELIASLLRKTSSSIQAEQDSRAGLRISRTNGDPSLEPLRNALSEWAENAHSELQEELDLAFSGRRWRKLGWWKLFWRVDDVGMLTNDILVQRFLPEAEKQSIFLAGRMRERGVGLHGPTDTIEPSRRSVNWPTSIPNSRAYLQTETVPALQALAQKLVVQTLSTSGLTTALGALAYVGTLSTTLYEAGAVAALGIVWSMSRMQKQWEKARDFWEGEVREEGRKAVKSAESTMASALIDNSTQGIETRDASTQDDLRKASDLVIRGQRLLEELK